jgi:hypothetical protein
LAVSYNDKYTLSQDQAFRNRVRTALLAFCGTVIGEDGRATVLHKERLTRAVAIVNQPDSFAPLYTNAAALDATVISDATQAGTVALTSGNVAAQGALVTDAHLDAAIAAQFNFFIVPL